MYIPRRGGGVSCRGGFFASLSIHKKGAPEPLPGLRDGYPVPLPV